MTKEEVLTAKNGRILLAVLMFLAVIVHWRVIYLFTMPVTPIGYYLFACLAAGGFFVFNILAGIGLLKQKNWGYVCGYFAVGMTTAFESVSYMPFLSALLPMTVIAHVTLVVNGLFLIALILLHLQHLKAKRQASV